jgi:serine/threonine-protein kinase
MERPALPETISHYRIQKKLGAGGMGEVYLAEDTVLDREVAIKFLPHDSLADEQAKRRLIREARAAAKLDHQNICAIHEVSEEAGYSFIVMPYVKGETLANRIRNRRLNLSDCLEIAVQVADALSEAHSHGIIHRDIKPANIMITPRGEVKVMDFGLAKFIRDKSVVQSEAMTDNYLTKPGVIIGTVPYMSPEQIRGDSVDAKSDIFSFGVVLYEMATLHHPFPGKNATATLAAILSSAPRSLSTHSKEIPAELETIVLRALQKNREERYPTIDDLLDDLRDLKSKYRTNQKPAKTVPSIAVLPFVNMSSDPDNEYFCDGLAEELINALTKIGQLYVMARTSAFSFKGKNISIGEIARALNVKTVLEGSVRKAGNRLRITAQLINAADGYHLWSERYDRNMEDIFDIQDEISLAIVDVLKGKLLGDEKTELLRRHTDDPQAYELYLKGRYYWNQRTRRGLQKAIDCFQQAISIDANYALAYAGMADAFNLLPGHGGLVPEECFPKARDAARKALEIDARLAEAYASLGFSSYRFYLDWSAARDYFNQAIKLNSNYATAHHWYSEFLTMTELFDEALLHSQRALYLDPLSLPINTDVGQTFFFARQYDQAIEQLKKTIDLDPIFTRAHIFQAVAYEQKKMYQQAIDHCRAAVASSGGSTFSLGTLGHIYSSAGKPKEAEKVLEELIELSGHSYVSPSDIAIVSIGLGRMDQALEWLEKAYDDRSVWLVWLKVDPRLDGLRAASPQFKSLLERIGFPHP